MDVSQFKSLNFSILGKNSDLKGDFQFSGDLLLQSRLEGSLTMVDKGKVILERDSYFKGDIYAHDIEIFGSFSGTINASGSLCVRSSGSVSGIINASSMSVFPGAQLNVEGHTQEEVN